MSSAPDADEIARDAHWLAQALDPGQGVVRLVAMNRESYRAASFLDDRVMQQPIDAQILPWPAVETALDREMRTDARWMFHIGHVGSTLLSRLIGELDEVLAIREPRLLRDIAMMPVEMRSRYLAAIPKLMSRTFGEEEVACIKATSFASEIAPDLVPDGGRALFIYAKPRSYIATILAGENSVKELRVLEQSRSERLARRGITIGLLRTDAERAGAAWACEMTTLESAAEAMSNRLVDWTDFDELLPALPQELGRIASFFGFSASADRLRQISSGTLVRRYSKDPRYEYGPELRQQLIQQELHLQGLDIDRALAMLASASEKSPLLARALRRAEGN